jgi:hypothetical protein
MSNLGVLMMMITGIVISAGVLGLAAFRLLPRRFVVVRQSGQSDCGPAALRVEFEKRRGPSPNMWPTFSCNSH